MSALLRFRQAIAKRFDLPLTPEIAAEIEAEAFLEPDRSIDPSEIPVEAHGETVLAVERFRDVVGELHALHVMHWGETERARHHMAMDPAYDVLIDEERTGRLLQVTARRRGRLIGHVRMYLRDDRHVKIRVAVEDALFVVPEVRGGSTAVRLVRYTEKVLGFLGVAEVRCTAKLVNRASRFLESCGYTPVATELVKFL